MKILYIPSGFFGVYPFFDQSIINEFTNQGYECKTFSHYNGITSFKKSLHTFTPDFVLTMAGLMMPEDMLTFLKKHGIKVAVWLTEDPYYIDVTSKIIFNYDYVFTVDKRALDVYHQLNHSDSYLLSLGTDTDIFKPKATNLIFKDLCLVGFPYPERIQLIKFLLEHSSYNIRVVGNEWEQHLGKWKKNERLHVMNWITPHKVADCYNSAKIILNTHRPHDLKENKNTRGVIGESINNRTFDIAACQAFQLISHKPELHSCFTHEEIVSFHTLDELLHKINYYITHDKERKKIAARAKNKVLAQHLFQHRLLEMVTKIHT